MSKVILVTGSSSGMGKEVCMQLAEKGYRVFASMRNKKNIEFVQEEAKNRKVSLEYVQLDVRDDDSVEKAVEKVVGEAGRIDVLINNAGYGLMGALETVKIEEIKEQYETNVFGVVRCIQAVLPYMRQQNSGVIINVSSAAALTGSPLASIYASSKFAIEGLTESLVGELAPFGIRVCIIEPGLVLTRFNEDSKKYGTRQIKLGNPYKTMQEKQDKFFARLRTTPAAQKVEDAVKTYIKAVEDTDFCLRYQTNPRIEALAQKRYVNPSQCVFMS